MNENNFNVDGFLRTLEQNQSKPKELGPTLRSLEKIYLSYPGNYGKYQIFPMNSVVTGYPFVILKDTREIKITKKNVLPDGTENVFDAWIKILPVDAYQMLDSTGRVVSSLTADDENLLIQASGVFDQLYEELGGNQKDQKLNKAISLLRRRNYTIFHGKCLNKWSLKIQGMQKELTSRHYLFVQLKDFPRQFKKVLMMHPFLMEVILIGWNKFIIDNYLDEEVI